MEEQLTVPSFDSVSNQVLLTAQTKNYIFNDEAIQNLSSLGETIRRIKNRMKSDGFEIKDGKYCAVVTPSIEIY